ncbi:hypothetical protein GCM10027176_75470 [Actinoallomurus bryophytorum]|uniref:Uncharacterized protein n=1 Tax=Actinoallomurus bryophytorum TaxID=1490222 RepID=A0A543CSQ5_9ACTN|nr:hypothetical protein [Actinoallomurus bryophytorum]TQM00041.1 hypothetical protein FB559_5745 [Actinoallomurus bryophytorum]
MSLIVPDFDESVIVRSAEAEVQELYDTYFLNSTNWNDARP